MLRVLVIDDNQDVRELIQFILEGAGYSVELAPDGAAGLRSQRARPADVVITDIFMPNQDGLETIARLREEYPGVRVVAMSGGGGSEIKGGRTLSPALEAGAHVLLPKPFDLDQLLRAVDDVSH